MNSPGKLFLMATAFAIYLAPVTSADQLKSAATLPYSVSVNQGVVVLEIVNTYWTTSQITTNPTSSALALAKARIISLLSPIMVAESNPLLQKSVISLALTKGGWKVYTPPPPRPNVQVPEAPAVGLLGLNLGLLVGLAFVFRRRILYLN
jgi:hypothetical protein